MANWTAVIVLQVLMVVRGKALRQMKNAKVCFDSDVDARSIRNHMMHLDTFRWWWRVTSWVRPEALCKLEMHRRIDGMFAFSSGLCSWINKDSRICSRSQLPNRKHGVTRHDSPAEPSPSPKYISSTLYSTALMILPFPTNWCTQNLLKLSECYLATGTPTTFWTVAFSNSLTENTVSHDNVTHRLNPLIHPNIFRL